MDKEKIRRNLLKLIERYKKTSQKELDDMSEDETRFKFINELLTDVLGWDASKIKMQKAIETKGSIKHSDYSYPKVPKIIVEAKKFSVDIEFPNWADEQVIGYAYSSAVNWAILTNFKFFRSYYITRDNRNKFCDLELTNENEIDKNVDQLFWFINENVMGNGLNEEAKFRRYTIKEIDIAGDFTVSLNSVREHLNKYIKNEYDKKYSDEEREELTQGIINRLIFIKKVEAGEIEPPKVERLYRDANRDKYSIKGKDIYVKLSEIFRDYRTKYDSDIFGEVTKKHPVEELEFPNHLVLKVLDTLTRPTSSIADYNYAAIGVDVLGNIYENYLAYVQKRAKLVGGASHKKEEGIYYTPKFIVDYIVNNTLGEALKGLEPDQVKKLRILDPACGSGSFLISSISALDEYYHDKLKKEYEDMSITDKLNLFKNNIYGVDKDYKAVQIAKLNMYLKILTLDNNTDKSVSNLLPTLDENIKVGNSLIQDSSIDKVAFKWEESMPNVIKYNDNHNLKDNYGFDIIIGNPPYIGEKGHKEIFREIKKDWMGKFYEGKMDIFYFFIHLALELGKEGSKIGFITTNYYPTATGGDKLRQHLKDSAIINKMVNFGELKLFKSAQGQHNMITIMSKGKPEKELAETIITDRKGKPTIDVLTKILEDKDESTNYYKIPQSRLYDGEDCQIRLKGIPSESGDKISKILQKMKSDAKLLGVVCNVNQGIVTGADKVSNKHLSKYGIAASKGEGIFVLTKDEVDSMNLSDKDKKILKPWFKNSDIGRWTTNIKTDEYVIYADKRQHNLDGNKLMKHLSKFIKILDASTSNSPYLHRPRDIKFDEAKIVAPQRSKTNTFGYNEIPWFASADVYFITKKEDNVSLKYILGLLNSKLYYLWFYHQGKRKGDMLELYWDPLYNTPIKISTEAEHKIVPLVDKIIDICKEQEHELKDGSKWKRLEEDKKVKEKKIDELVCNLYGLDDKQTEYVMND